MMEKTTCMGGCPAYKFEVFLDKTAIYTGKSNVENIGQFSATLTDAQIDMLKNEFVEANFFSFANVYSAPFTDLPTTFIYYNNGTDFSKVTDYYGAPDELKNLEKKIEEFIVTLQWRKK